ncbi:hypothetical protein K438DRAFT_1593552 [Mycena galopus ATCC 62051]|nr:hypothetical protein K438DRAFT_1593552 [Mycena galopus ATCC 62051]
MTRTSRSASLRSILKDRSENKTGVNSNMRKNGAGAHNWGSLENEVRFLCTTLTWQKLTRRPPAARPGKSSPTSPVLELSEEDLASARKVRMNAFKNGGVDLAAIARTSVAVSGSPPKATVPVIASDAQSVTSVDSV